MNKQYLTDALNNALAYALSHDKQLMTLGASMEDLTLYPYTDDQGQEIYIKARFDTDKGKWIKPFYLDGARYKMAMPKLTQKPLYHLPRLLGADVVYVVEGEKCADCLIQIGLTATTFGGATSLKGHDLTPLQGKKCMLWCDNDNSGYEWLDKLIIALNELKITYDVIDTDSITLANGEPLGDKADCFDYVQSHFADGNDYAGVANLIERLPLVDMGEWGSLAPLDNNTNIKNHYPVQAFGELADVITAISEYAQTPLSMAGNSVLGALSTICQCLVNAPMGSEYKPVSLFLLTESPSGAGKTQVNKLAYKAVYDYDARIYQEFINDVAEWKKAKDTLKGKDKAEFFNYHNEPINQTLALKSSSIEKIIDRFVKGEAHNLAWVTDEAGLFFGGYSMKSDTNAHALSTLTDLWSTGTANYQRMGNKTPYTNAYNCRFTLDLSGQRVIIEPAINNELMNGQGFLARCLFSCEPSLIGDRDWITERDPSTNTALQSYWKRCNSLLELGEMYDKDGKPNRFNMPFDDEARFYLSQYQQSIEYQQKKGARLANLTAFASRMAENATRIATILAYYDGKKKLSKDYLQRAFLLVEFSINERLFYNERSDEPSHAQKLFDHLIKRQENGKVLYSQAQSTAPKALRKKEEFVLSLEVLAEANYIKIKEQDGKRYIVINPSLI